MMLITVAPIESYKHKLAQLQMQILGRGGMATTEPDGKSAEHDVSQCRRETVDMSPVRNRLDSPAAKARTPLRVNAGLGDGSPSSKDSTIVSLKERLARLRQGGASD